MTLHQMGLLRGYPDADNPTTAGWCPATVSLYRQDLEYMPDLAFAGIRPARAAYEAAAQDFCTNVGHLRLLSSRLNAPAAAQAAAQASAAAQQRDLSGAAVAVGMAGLQAKLQQAVRALQQELWCLSEKLVPAEQVRLLLL
jgi:hypothetical protein